MPYKDPQKRKDYSKAYNKEWYEKTKKKRLKQIYARKKKINCGTKHIKKTLAVLYVASIKNQKL